jgi:hypothetical protein
MMSSEEMKLDTLRKKANESLKSAITAWHEYANELPVGDIRTEAFQVFENLRNSTRRW